MGGRQIPRNIFPLAPLEYASLKHFGEMRQKTFAKNLAGDARLTASNFRGNRRTFAPANLIDEDPSTYWATDDEVTTPELEVEFTQPVTFSVIRLGEALRLGQRIGSFEIDVRSGNAWRTLAAETSIGNCRLIRTGEPVTTTNLRLRITSSPVCPALSDFGLFAE